MKENLESIYQQKHIIHMETAKGRNLVTKFSNDGQDPCVLFTH